MNAVDRDGKQLPLKWWTADPEWYATDKRVGSTEVNGMRLSTVWLAIEHPGGMFYESMIFGGEYDQEMVFRYRTEEEALRGHLAILDALRAGRSPHDVDLREVL